MHPLGICFYIFVKNMPFSRDYAVVITRTCPGSDVKNSKLKPILNIAEVNVNTGIEYIFFSLFWEMLIPLLWHCVLSHAHLTDRHHWSWIGLIHAAHGNGNNVNKFSIKLSILLLIVLNIVFRENQGRISLVIKRLQVVHACICHLRSISGHGHG